MTRAWKVQVGHVTILPRTNHPGNVEPDLIDQRRLRLAIMYASQMAEKTLHSMLDLKFGKLQGQQRLEVLYALAKYFSIHPSDAEFTAYLDGILKVYLAIKKGLDAPYDIVIFDPDDRNSSKALGYVRPTRTIVRQGTSISNSSPDPTPL